MFVPSYNPSIFTAYGVNNYLMSMGGAYEKYKLCQVDFERRKNDLFKEIEENRNNLLMCHLHMPDHIHHLFWEIGKEKEVKEMYNEMDELAGEIKKKAADKYDCIIFMSDHGLPTETEHNENAFYSCNRELFPDKEPHITDFHDKILELAVDENKEVMDIEV